MQDFRRRASTVGLHERPRALADCGAPPGRELRTSRVDAARARARWAKRLQSCAGLNLCARPAEAVTGRGETAPTATATRRGEPNDPSATLPRNSRQLVFTSSQAARYLGVSLATDPPLDGRRATSAATARPAASGASRASSSTTSSPRCTARAQPRRPTASPRCAAPAERPRRVASRTSRSQRRAARHGCPRSARQAAELLAQAAVEG